MVENDHGNGITNDQVEYALCVTLGNRAHTTQDMDCKSVLCRSVIYALPPDPCRTNNPKQVIKEPGNHHQGHPMSTTNPSLTVESPVHIRCCAESVILGLDV